LTHIVDQKDATDAASVGGKAASLAALADHGFAPPAFFVIKAQAFVGGIPTPDLEGELTTALQSLGAGPFAVRSSGRAEDGIAHSHAGQFDTILNVAASDVLSAAQQVWKSGFSETVTTYLVATSGDAPEAPAIIVQRMIDADAAGVAFSADPVSGLRGQVVISAVSGLGEALVSGVVDGEEWTFDQSDMILTRPTTNVLSEDQARAIADLARRAETTFQYPQDIEWAIDGAGLHILQSRPITTPILPVQMEDSALTIFDNSNIVESYPGMVSPLTYSFAVHVYARVYRAFVDLLGVPVRTIDANAAVFGNMLGRIDGRVYYNLVNWYRALALLPGFSLNRAYMETMMGVSEPLPAEVTDAIGPSPATGLARVVEYAKLARVAAGLGWQALRLSRTRRQFYERLNATLDSDLDLNAAAPTALANEYRQIESTLLDQWDAPLINDFLCMIAFGASRNMLHKWLGEPGLTLHNDVMIGQGDIVSAEPAKRIAKIGTMIRTQGIMGPIDMKTLAAFPDISAAVSSYLAKFGDRCTEELKLESIPLTDDPTSLMLAISAHAVRDERTHVQAQDPDWARLFTGQPIKRHVAQWFISWTKARVRDRENLRFERTRIFGYARRVFLALGREFAARGLIVAERDVFFLTKDEILGAVEGFGLSPDLKGIVALRKVEDAASANRPDPPERITIRGPAIAPRWNANPTGQINSEMVQTGTGCAAGNVTATARVIRDPRIESLAPGDILVARHTDPGWIAVFSQSSAIVVERGSLLSHSAIVARELGIPCVVGVKDATHWIADGQRITVDGATGRVEKHDA
jgi:pyruvate,water dikinase